jgi:aspartate/glutamate racemase
MGGPQTKAEQYLKLAHVLLRPDELKIPEAVERTVLFLTEKGIWFQLSRNYEARSCRDAANKRQRLGHEGIPLWDDLKSFFGIFVNAAGLKQPVLAHCRGDRLLNLNHLAEVLHARGLPTRMTDEELRAFGMEYGLVNPFGSKQIPMIPDRYSLDARFLSSPILQVFDKELISRFGIPGTVMTNAGDLTWAVEFFADELVKHIDNTLVESISLPDPEETSRPVSAQQRRAIGIITGNAPESGITLWNYINGFVRTHLGRNCCGDISMPPVIVQSVPEMGLSMELDSREDQVWNALRVAVLDMGRQGVRLLAIADNTTHYFAPEIRAICHQYGMEFISMPEELATWLYTRGKRRIALVGIRYVADLGRWSAYREPLTGMEVEKLSERATLLIHELAYQVKTEGATEAGLNRLRDILRREVVSDTIVLALTELSLLLQRQRQKGRSGKTLIDPLEVYADAIVQKYLMI